MKILYIKNKSMKKGYFIFEIMNNSIILKISIDRQKKYKLFFNTIKYFNNY